MQAQYYPPSLLQLEQEIEHIREGQWMLEAGTNRREKLEGALRAKLEKQVRSLKGETVHLKGKGCCVSACHEHVIRVRAKLCLIYL